MMQPKILNVTWGFTGDKELIEFLSEEIAAEKKSSKSKAISNLDGFDVKLNGSELVLSKKFNDEQ